MRAAQPQHPTRQRSNMAANPYSSIPKSQHNGGQYRLMEQPSQFSQPNAVTPGSYHTTSP